MTKKVRLALAAVLSIALIAMPTTATDYVISEAGGQMAWSLGKAYGNASLVVTGPNDFHYARNFADGEAPSFSVYDDLGELADGPYKWSLTVTSKVSDSLREDMEAARAAGDAAYLQSLKVQGLFSSDVYSGNFLKVNGSLVVPELSAAPEGVSDVAASAKALPTKAQVYITDLIVQGSGCVGIDCTSSESFGFDTIRLKENNLRIKFDDTSSSANFPGNDWQLTANDSANGGANKFSVDDITSGKTPFTIAAGAPNHTLYVSDTGRIGIETNSPVVDIHTVDGNTPTLRLEQDGSDGFTPQSWDLAGNETNFFIRDVTGGSLLPFRIESGAARNSVLIDDQGRTGFGVADSGPSQDLHMLSTDGDGQLLIQETNDNVTQRVLLKLENKGVPSFQLENTDSTEKWAFSVKTNEFEISKGGTGVSEFRVDGSGNVTILGTLTTAGSTYPDYVFRDGYDLMTLDEVEAFIDENGHLPNVKSEAEVEYGKRINMTELSISLLEKVEELTLYTIDQHKALAEQNELIRRLENRLATLEGEGR